jgi:uncharacterized membrane protein YciS (DUF1049 family)
MNNTILILLAVIFFSTLVGPIIIMAYVIQKLIVKCDILEKRIKYLERKTGYDYSGFLEGLKYQRNF